MAAMVAPDKAFWGGKRVLLTGHSGFKGGWLWIWLEHLGALPFGLSLPPETDPSLFELTGIVRHPSSALGDITDLDTVRRRTAEVAPDIILHLAAQPLVRRAYAEPVLTFSTNVMGTIHVMEAARGTPSVKALVCVTTDKVYQNEEWIWPYRETDRLGGHDPYSASKAACEIALAAWRSSYFTSSGVRVATARAGNVIGGGDWAADRLVPDCIRAMSLGQPVEIRNPNATRPWQHVLEPLLGYLILAERLWADALPPVAEAWNFGPDAASVQPVRVVVDEMTRLWGNGASVRVSAGDHPHEAGLLAVDAAKARARLGWRPKLDLSTALAWTVAWSRAHLAGEDAREMVLRQIQAFEQRPDLP